MSFPPDVNPARGIFALANVETLLEDSTTVLRLLGCPGEADRLDAVRLAVRVVRLQRAQQIEQGHGPQEVTS